MAFLVQHLLENSAKHLPDKVALVCGEDRLTYKKINEKADRLATALIESGIRRQDRIAIFMDNSTESVISLFGILKAGGIFIMLNASMKIKKLNYILNDSGARFLIAHQNKGPIVKEATKKAGDLKHIIWVSNTNTVSSLQSSACNLKSIKTSSWNVFTRLPSFEKSLTTVKGIDLDLATIIYTSGSTAEPKGVMSAHYNVISAARSITTYLENVENDIILCALPLSFDYGLYQVFMAFLFGGTVVLEKSFMFPYKMLERLVNEKVTGFPVVPTMVALLQQFDDLSKFNFSSLRYISSTAAVLPIAYTRKLQKMFSDAKIFSMYGLTECKRVSYMPPEELSHRPDSVGIPMPNEEVFIIDKKGNEVKHGEIGELVIRGSNVMQGYWNDPVTTARTFRYDRNRKSRVLYTGDLFRKDEDGFLSFVGRRDEMIKAKGERISPKEIEDTLCEIEGVVAAAAIGIPNEKFGSVIKGFIMTKKDSKLTEKIVLKHCKNNLEPFMIPKSIEFRDKLPISASGKIDKKRLS